MGEASADLDRRHGDGTGSPGSFPDALQLAVLCVLSVLPDAAGAALAAGLDAVAESGGPSASPALRAAFRAPVALLAWWPVLAFGASWARLPWRRAYPVTAPAPGVVPGFVVAQGGAIVLLAGLAAWGRRVMPVPAFLAEATSALDSGAAGLVTPGAEELLYRGLLLLALLRRRPPWRAILLVAVLYASTRLDPWQLPAALALGVAHGWVVAATGSLALPLVGVCMQAAASWLAQAGAVARFAGPDGAVPLPTWLAGAVALAAGVGLLRLAGLRVRRPEGVASAESGAGPHSP